MSRVYTTVTVDVDVDYTLENVLFFIENADVDELKRIIDVAKYCLSENEEVVE